MRAWMALALACACGWAVGCGTPRGGKAELAKADIEEPVAPASTGAVQYVIRPHLRFRDEVEVAAYMSLNAEKKKTIEDFRALTRLLQQKAYEIKALNETLEKEFQYVPGKEYSFDPKTRSLEVEEDDGKGGIVSREIMKLDPTAEARFTTLLEQRKAMLAEAATLHAGGIRVQGDLKALQDRLHKTYSMVGERGYQLNPTTRMLYERVPVPAGLVLEGEPDPLQRR